MKKILLLFAALGFACFVNAQTVENITVHTEGEKIIVSYRIGGSTESQYYNVELSCSVGGGTRFDPKTVIGDVGENIRGGRSYYKIEWDVFKDVDEVADAEFFIKVDLVSDLSPKVTQPQNQPVVQPQVQKQDEPVQTETRQQNPGLPDNDFEAVSTQKQKQEVSWSAYLAYSGSTESPVGISFGSLKKVGVYGSFRYGSAINTYQTDIWITLIGGLTAHLFHSGNYRLHAHLGGGMTYEVYEEFTYGTNWTDSYATIDGGIINALGRLNLNLGFEYVRSVGTFPVFGIGIAF